MSNGLRGLTTLQYLGGSLGAHKGLHGNELEVKIDIYHTQRRILTFIYSHLIHYVFVLSILLFDFSILLMGNKKSLSIQANRKLINSHLKINNDFTNI